MRDSICNDCAKRTKCDMAEIGRSPLAISTCYCYEKGNPTNADRIRAMTDEELAKWLDDISKACYYEGYTKETDEPHMSPYPTSPTKWVAWLKQEVSK